MDPRFVRACVRNGSCFSRFLTRVQPSRHSQIWQTPSSLPQRISFDRHERFKKAPKCATAFPATLALGSLRQKPRCASLGLTRTSLITFFS